MKNDNLLLSNSTEDRIPIYLFKVHWWFSTWLCCLILNFHMTTMNSFSYTLQTGNFCDFPNAVNEKRQHLNLINLFASYKVKQLKKSKIRSQHLWNVLCMLAVCASSPCACLLLRNHSFEGSGFFSSICLLQFLLIIFLTN